MANVKLISDADLPDAASRLANMEAKGAAFDAQVAAGQVLPLFRSYGSKTVANTAAEQSTIPATFVGSLTLPANFWTVSKAVILRGGGVASTATLLPGNLTVRIKLGTVVLASVTITNLPIGLVNNAFDFEVMIQCVTVGTSGSLVIAGGLNYATAISTRGYADLANGGAPIAVNTTLPAALDVTAQWQTANAANSIKTMVSFIQAVG